MGFDAAHVGKDTVRIARNILVPTRRETPRRPRRDCIEREGTRRALNVNLLQAVAQLDLGQLKSVSCTISLEGSLWSCVRRCPTIESEKVKKEGSRSSDRPSRKVASSNANPDEIARDGVFSVIDGQV